MPRLFDFPLGGFEGLGSSLLVFSLFGPNAEVVLEIDGIVISPLSVELSISILTLSPLSSAFLLDIFTSKFPTLGIC